MTNQQETFWKNEITQSYVADNSRFDEMLGQATREIILTTFTLYRNTNHRFVRIN